MYITTITMQNIEIWKTLHCPFILCGAQKQYHTCKWMVFDSGVAGCVLCGNIHQCASSNCEHVTLTEDSFVCNITGVCINRFIPDEYNEYTDTTMPCQESIHMKTNDETSFNIAVKSNVKHFLKQLLLSENACKNWKAETFKHKKTTHVEHLFTNALKKKKCMVRACEQIIMQDNQNQNTFNRCEREKLCKLSEKYIVYLLLQTINMPHLSIRISEIRNHTVGLLYLMRFGIYVYDLCILPALPDLIKYLPRESNLQKKFGIKAKYITDTENKFKFAFRLMQKKQLEQFIQTNIE